MQALSDPVRIVFEGASKNFKSAVERWWKGPVVDVGRLVTLTVPRRELEEIRRRLHRRQYPKGMLCADIPAVRGGELPERIVAPADENEVKMLETSAGRHIQLSALPSELAGPRGQRRSTRHSCR